MANILWQTYDGKYIMANILWQIYYGKRIMANETEPFGLLRIQ